MDSYQTKQAKENQWIRPQGDIIFEIHKDTDTLPLKKLPESASKVKIHLCFQFGYCKQEHVVSWQFSTFKDITQITGHPYKQDAWSVTNEVVTLYLDDRKVIDVQRIGDYPDGYVKFTCQILGFK